MGFIVAIPFAFISVLVLSWICPLECWTEHPHNQPASKDKKLLSGAPKCQNLNPT